MIFIDAPKGWEYGFPMQITEEGLKDVNKYLVDNGYPKELIEKLGDKFYVRIFEI